MTIDKINSIKTILEQLPTTKLEGLKKLFWEELNYNIDNTSVATAGWPEGLSNFFVETPISFGTFTHNDEFHILYFHLDAEKLLLGTERQVINALIKDYPYSLFVFSNRSQYHWHFVNAIHSDGKKSTKQRILRRISISKDDRLRTASERITRLDTTLAGADLFGISPIKIQQQHEEAFDVEAVTEEFFNEYKAIFTELRNSLLSQSHDSAWSHDFALQFMNRLMFIYYIERKRWLGHNPDFLHDFWREYLKTHRGSNTFVDEWLNILFFQAFNNNFAAGRSDLAHIPEAFRNALQMAPYLNGSLFTKNELDDKYPYDIKDHLIESILDFLDNYNFTISEDTPLDQEVAVDPEMIGKVYETLVNVSEEADEQGDAGIFYTPRIEIDLMCRLSLVDWLSNQLPDAPKNAFYELVFAFSPEEKQDADNWIKELDLWLHVDQLLNGITVLDPACGSGSFLVGMLGILDDLLIRSATQLGCQETPYERRKRIIGNSLYGVDIMEWAVHVAELRLWLQLVIETEMEQAELKIEPLLPNLSFKIRHGDSLVQEMGGLNLSLHRSGGQITGVSAAKLTSLKTEKLKFYNNDHSCKYRTKTELEHAEYLLFQHIIDDQIHENEKRRVELNYTLTPATNLFGEVQTTQMKLDAANTERDLKEIVETLASLRVAKTVLQNQKVVPFAWDIAFVEIFEGEKGGFDIIVGNPPYTRQEKIRNLALPPEFVTTENKKDYKEKLAKAVYNAWPKTFGYNPARGNVTWSLNKQSDLYIYFYFISLSLISVEGSFCFITSNAWLDVGYGADLQRFLLTRGKVKLVIDNQVKRSFKSADVNTVIVQLGCPRDSKQDRVSMLARPARFVMFTVPFEEGLSPVLWEEIEEVQEKQVSNEYRVLVKPQGELLEAGMDDESGKYVSDKWGGKYLRAPDIYWYIMEKCKDKLVRLGDIADVRRGITTGANEFFYLDEAKIKQWGIEDEFLVPVIKNSKELYRIFLSTAMSTKLKLLMFHRSILEIKHTNLYEYIRFGETRGYDKRPSCSCRKNWYNLGERDPATINCNYQIGQIMRFFISDEGFYVSDNFQEIHTNINTYQLAASLNSNIGQLNANILGRSNFGDGLLKIQTYEVKEMSIPNPKIIPPDVKSIIRKSDLLLFNNDDRKMLDATVGKSLGLTIGEIESITEASMTLVYKRSQKAQT